MSVPAEPDLAIEYFGVAVYGMRRYVELLAGPGVERGLIGPHEVPRIWDRHVLNCAVVVDAVPADASVADVGSGAGLPGLVWALTRPDLKVTLIEPLLRRARFLDETVATLQLANVAVRRTRAEDAASEVAVDVVTARAVAPLGKLARWTLPLVRPGGRLLAFKGESVDAEVAAAESELRRLGAVSWRVREFGSGIVDPVTRVAVVELG